MSPTEIFTTGDQGSAIFLVVSIVAIVALWIGLYRYGGN